MTKELTAERLRELLDYDQNTGLFRVKAPRRRVTIGSIAGVLTRSPKHNYWKIGIDKRYYYGHRLAWLYVHGEWPPAHIDHINGNGADNRLVNLRCATQNQNIANARKRSDNTSGHKGITWSKKQNCWAAQLHKNGKHIHLGLFALKEDAIKARQEAAKLHFGEFARLE